MNPETKKNYKIQLIAAVAALIAITAHNVLAQDASSLAQPNPATATTAPSNNSETPISETPSTESSAATTTEETSTPASTTAAPAPIQPAEPIAETQYFIYTNGVSTGPFTQSIMDQKAASGEITRDTQVAVAGTQTWVLAETVIPFPETLWYVEQNGTATGPYPQSEVQKMADGLRIHPATRVNRMGDQAWVGAGTAFAFPQGVHAPPALTATAATPAISPELQAQIDAEKKNYLHNKARHVRAGNIMTGIGIVAGTAGAVMQVAGLSNDSDELYYAGMGVAVPFSILRLTGAIVSGVAARKYTRHAGTPKFKWGLFWGGFAAALVGAIVTTSMEESGDLEEGPYYGVQLGTQAAMDLFWIAHCLRAKRVTKAHRDVATAPLKPQYGLHPIVNTASNNYGLALSVLY